MKLRAYFHASPFPVLTTRETVWVRIPTPGAYDPRVYPPPFGEPDGAVDTPLTST